MDFSSLISWDSESGGNIKGDSTRNQKEGGRQVLGKEKEREGRQVLMTQGAGVEMKKEVRKRDE